MTISQQIQDILCDNPSMSDAIELLRQRLEALGNWDLKSKMEQVEYTYNSMLDYLLQNYIGADIQKELAQIRTSIYSLNIQADRLERIKNQPTDEYFVALRLIKPDQSLAYFITELKNTNEQLEDILSDKSIRETIRQHDLQPLYDDIEALRIRLFNQVWTSDQWSNADMECAMNALSDESFGKENQAILISAITLSAIEYFDPKKLEVLINAYLLKDPEVSIRSMVGIAILAKQHSDVIIIFDEISHNFNHLRKDDSFCKDFYMVITQLEYSAITDKITSKMNNDILPSIAKNTGLFNIKADSMNISVLGANPEWDEIRNDSKVMKKVQQMADMQSSGADVHMSSFRHMKGYEFFKKVPHWFYPFNFKNNQFPEINNLINSSNGRYVEFMLKSSGFCDSDKYSLCFSLSKLGNFATGSLAAEVNSAIDEDKMNDVLETFESEATNPSRHTICRNYVFDLYRFFTLSSCSNQITNPFIDRDEDGNKIIGEFFPEETRYYFLDDDELKLAYGDFLIRNGLFEQARTVLTDLIPLGEAELFQKLGFCYEQIGDNDAMTTIFYHRANSLKPNSEWTLRHLSNILIKNEIWDEAVKYLDQIIEICPENCKYLNNAALTYFMLEDYDKALELAFKAQYIDEDSADTDLIIKCYIITEQYDKAAELTIATDNFRYSLIAAFIFLKEENNISAHEMLKIAWNQWQALESKDKHTFKEEFYDTYDEYCKDLVDFRILGMLYDAIILRA